MDGNCTSSTGTLDNSSPHVGSVTAVLIFPDKLALIMVPSLVCLMGF
tara:strand:- start:26 stop:166 length:141 start_codon:yes stop_codon:yes gene_type:complete